MKAPVWGWSRVDATTIIKPGKHLAILYSVVDLWTHQQTSQHGTKEVRKVQLSRELPTVLHEFKPGEGEKPAAVRKKYTLSMYKMAELRMIVNNILWLDLSDVEARDFDLSNLLGVMCQLQLVHDSYEGNNYVKPTNYISLSEEEKEFYASKWIKQYNPSVLFSLDEFDQAVFDNLPQFIKDIIIQSPEYNEIKHGADRTEEELVDELESEGAQIDQMMSEEGERPEQTVDEDPPF